MATEQSDELKQLLQTLPPLSILNTLIKGEKNSVTNSHTKKTYHVTYNQTTKLRSIQIENFLILQQDPNKRSKWAKAAQRGDTVFWILQKTKSQPHGNYIACVINTQVRKETEIW